MSIPDSTDWALVVEFMDWSGSAPDGVWRAPGRVNLIGEHLDYNGGHVAPFAITRSVRLAARRTRRPVLRLRSTAYPDTVEVPLGALAQSTGWAAYLAGVVWALSATIEPFGADVLVDSDIPPGAGLSSSAALECAAALAVADLAGSPTGTDGERLRLASAAQRAEAAVAGAPVGIMDPAVSLLGRAGHVLLLDCADLTFAHLPLDLAPAGLFLLAVDTGARHDLTAGDYAERRRGCESAAAILGVDHLAKVTLDQLDEAPLPAGIAGWARHVVTEEARVRQLAEDLAQHRLDRLGDLMTASHRSMQFDFANSTPTVDATVHAALAAGALGARMTGGGWGGTVIFLAETAAAGRVGAAVEDAVEADTGHRPAAREVRPAAGAERLM